MLEARTLLSTVPFGLDRGDYYEYKDQSIQLNQATDQVLIAIDSGRDQSVVDSLVAPGGLLAGGTVTTLNAHLRLWTVDLASPVASGDAFDQLVSQVSTADGIDYASSSFYVPGGTSRLYATRDIVVGLQPGVDPATVFQGSNYAGYRNVRGTTDQFVVTTVAAPGRATIALGNALGGDSRVSFSTADFVVKATPLAVPNDPLLNQEWHLNNTGQFGALAGADAKVQATWQLGITGQGVVIAIVDDSVQLDHPDLAPHLWTNPGEIAGNGVDDDGNGYIDDIHGWDFGDNDNDPSPSLASDNHGTSVAGVAAGAGNNGIGVAGAAYDAQIMAVRTGAMPYSTWAESIYYVSGRTADGTGTWKAADVVNHSYHVGDSPSIVHEASFAWANTYGRNGKGVIHLAASGNAAETAGQANASIWPSGYPEVVCVGGSTDHDVRVSYSQYGSNLSFVAPTGGYGFNGLLNIVTTDRTGRGGYDPTSDYTGLYATGFNGTSSATPLASGVAALVLQADPTLTWMQVRDAMRKTADKIGPIAYVNGKNDQYGYGRINAEEAVLSVLTRLSVVVPTNLVENTVYTNQVVGQLTFSGSTAPSDLSEYKVTVDLGQGAPAVTANLVSAGGLVYNVVVPSMTYAEGGTYNITLTLLRQTTVVTTATGVLSVKDLPINVSPRPLSDVAEGAASSFFVATFIDTDPDVSPAGSYGASIKWGDGTQSAGTIVATADPHTFEVRGTHTYAGGSYKITVTVVGPGGGLNTATTNVNVVNSDFATSVVPIAATEGTAFSGPLGWFLDSDPRKPAASYYRASIDWGDGPYVSSDVGQPIPDYTTAATPLVSYLRLNLGNYTIADLNLNLTVVHDRPGDLTAVLIGPDGTRVRLFSGLAGGGTNWQIPLRGLIGTTFDDSATASIASGKNPFTGTFKPAEALSAFNGKDLSGTWRLELTDGTPGFTGRLVSWSLATKAEATIASDPIQGGYQILGDHIYQVGSYTVGIELQDGDVTKIPLTTTATVSNAPVTGSPGKVNVTVGTAFSGIVAYFYDANPYADATSFAATIDWGDGTTTAGRVTPDGGGQFVVTGSHTYTTPSVTVANPAGTFPLVVKVTERNVTGDALVQDVAGRVSDTQISTDTTAITVSEGQSLVSQPLATFTDPNLLADATDYSATIEFGNGVIQAGGVLPVLDSNGVAVPGSFRVVSLYSYPKAGNYSAIVRITNQGGFVTPITVAVTVSDAPLVAGTVPMIRAIERTPTGTILVGVFHDTNLVGTSVDQFLPVQIDWGDGTTSTATAQAGNNGEYTIWTAHTFALPGTFTVTSVVTSAQGSTVTLKTSAVVGDLILPLSGALESSSDTGVSSSDAITRSGALVFTGSADKLSKITLFSRPVGGSTLTTLATTTSDGNGNWRIGLTGLGQGSYEILAQATDTAGNPGSVLTSLYGASSPLVVDSSRPTLPAVQYEAKTGTFRLTYSDNLSGLNTSTLYQPSNYVLTRPGGRSVTAKSVAGVAGDPNSVLLKFSTGRLTGNYVLLVNSQGITDRAGNQLDAGTFTASVKNPAPGAPYVAVFELNPPRVARPRAISFGQQRWGSITRLLRG